MKKRWIAIALLAVLLFVLAVVLAVKGVKTIVATAKRNAA